MHVSNLPYDRSIGAGVGGGRENDWNVEQFSQRGVAEEIGFKLRWQYIADEVKESFLIVND